MPVRLIDSNATYDIVVSGTKFTAKQLTQGDAIKFNAAKREALLFAGDERSLAEMTRILIQYIAYCDMATDDLTIEHIVKNMCWEDLLMLAVNFATKATLNEAESKNSDSSCEPKS